MEQVESDENAFQLLTKACRRVIPDLPRSKPYSLLPLVTDNSFQSIVANEILDGEIEFKNHIERLANLHYYGSRRVSNPHHISDYKKTDILSLLERRNRRL